MPQTDNPEARALSQENNRKQEPSKSNSTMKKIFSIIASEDFAIVTTAITVVALIFWRA